MWRNLPVLYSNLDVDALLFLRKFVVFRQLLDHPLARAFAHCELEAQFHNSLNERRRWIWRV